MERLKNMGLKRSFLILSVGCVAVSFALLAASFFIFQGIKKMYPTGGIEIYPDGSSVMLPEPSAAQQTLITMLDVTQVVLCILLPMGGVIASVALFYRLKLKRPIEALRGGIARIEKNDLDFSIPVQSQDEMGQLCAAFESMRRELLQTNRLLWQQAEERKRLNAAFSHDLRNPITVLKGTVKLLRQGIPDEQAVERLEGYTLRIEQYVEAMSGIQRLEQLACRPAAVALPVLRDELQETARLLVPSKEVSLTMPGGGSVRVDHGFFLTVAENLIGNAARFVRVKLSIQVEMEPDALRLCVTDDGPGYPPTLLQKGPKPFETASSNAAHFGMGLYSSLLLCEKHGGRLILENAPAGGARATAIFRLFKES